MLLDLGMSYLSKINPKVRGPTCYIIDVHMNEKEVTKNVNKWLLKKKMEVIRELPVSLSPIRSITISTRLTVEYTLNEFLSQYHVKIVPRKKNLMSIHEDFAIITVRYTISGTKNAETILNDFLRQSHKLDVELSRKEHLVLALRAESPYGAGMSLSKIAENLEVKPQAVVTWISRIKARFFGIFPEIRAIIEQYEEAMR